MLFGQDLGQRTSREHKFAFDELLSFIGPAIRSEKWTIFWKSLPPVRKAGQCGWLKYSYVGAMICAGQASIKRRKPSVEGIGMVL